MGASGRDILLSEAALSVFGWAVECKNRKSMAVFTDFAQATSNSEPPKALPLLIIKENHSKPLAVLDLDHFMELVKEAHGNHEDN